MTCPKCNDTGSRPLTDEEYDDELEACEVEEARTDTWCECEIGRARKKAFWDRVTPLIEEELRKHNGGGY